MSLQENQTLKINIENYSGPLEVLLDLAKAQKVDLTNISITQLADEFIKFINQAKDLNLDLNKRPAELNNETYYKIAINYEKLLS